MQTIKQEKIGTPFSVEMVTSFFPNFETCKLELIYDENCLRKGSKKSVLPCEWRSLHHFSPVLKTLLRILI